MKRRISGQSESSHPSRETSTQKPKPDAHLPKKMRQLQPEQSRDTFLGKNFITTSSIRQNSMEKVIGNSTNANAILSRVTESLRQGVPFTFAANKKGSKFSIRADTDELIQTFIENKLSPVKRGEIYFCSFIEEHKAPLVLGTPSSIEKTGADDILRSYLLEPQQLEDDHQLRSRVFFRSLMDACGISSSFPGFLDKLRTFSELDDVSFAERELLIETAALEKTFLLKTLLDLGFSPNSFSSETGTWAVTVAKRHNRDEALKLLAEHGADMNVREQTPL